MIEKTGPRIRANRKQQQILCALFQETRAKAGLSQERLALKLGKPQSFVSKYESGSRRLDLLELRGVCNALGVSVSDFVRLFDQRVGKS